MKLIVRNGIHTKHTPANTFDSLLLAIHTNYISGIEVNLNMTKDKKIIVYQSDTIDKYPVHKISELTLSELQKYNLGSKVKKHHILTLEDVLQLFSSTSKLLILNLNSHESHNLEFVQIVVSYINQYPNDNVYIKSPCKEIVLEMKDAINKARMGAVIMNLDSYFWNLDLDFYSISVQKTKINECSHNIQIQLENNHFIMLGDIYDSKTYENVRNVLGDDIMEKVYIITSNVVGLANDYYQS